MGVLNVTADVETQKNAFLHANFGTDVEIEEPSDIESVTDEQLELLLEKAKVEYSDVKPPVTSLQCAYKFNRPRNRSLLSFR